MFCDICTASPSNNVNIAGVPISEHGKTAYTPTSCLCEGSVSCQPNRAYVTIPTSTFRKSPTVTERQRQAFAVYHDGRDSNGEPSFKTTSTVTQPAGWKSTARCCSSIVPGSLSAEGCPNMVAPKHIGMPLQSYCKLTISVQVCSCWWIAMWTFCVARAAKEGSFDKNGVGPICENFWHSVSNDALE